MTSSNVLYASAERVGEEFDISLLYDHVARESTGQIHKAQVE